MATPVYKQICFNELTLQPLCLDDTEAYRRVSLFAQTLQAAQKSFGTKVVRYASDLSSIYLADGISLLEFCSRYKSDPKIIAILSSHTMPQVDPENEKISVAFEDTSALIQINDEVVSSVGFAAAYVYNTLTIGFDSENIWNNVIHNIRISSKGRGQDVFWPCITNPKHIECDQFKDWIQEHSKLSLIETTLSFEDKEVSLRDDHGKDILTEHATRLCHNKYVDGILTSLPFRRKFGSYIYKVYDDGLVDIVLYWDDRGLSMRVKTTGRNIQETLAIANILKEQYGK